LLPAGDHLIINSTVDSQLAGWLAVKLLLALTNTAILGFESHETRDHILLSDSFGSLQRNSKAT
jgi:hypothetical protein